MQVYHYACAIVSKTEQRCTGKMTTAGAGACTDALASQRANPPVRYVQQHPLSRYLLNSPDRYRRVLDA